MATIVISEFMDEAAVESLKPDFDVLYDPALVDNADALAAALGDCRALIVRNRTQVRQSVLQAAPALSVVGRLGVGLDNIDVEGCRRRGISIFPATGANNLAVAEYVIAGLLMLLRGAYHASPDMVGGAWPRNALIGREVDGKRLGLVGFGGIARDVAVRARALGMSVVATDRFVAANASVWREHGVDPLELDEVLRTSDAVSLHVPLTDETRNIIDSGALAKMRRNAVLINSARGGVVDERALVDVAQVGPSRRRHARRLRAGTSQGGRRRLRRRAEPRSHAAYRGGERGIQRSRFRGHRSKRAQGFGETAMNSITLPLHDVEDLAVDILVAHDTSETNARSVARALVAAETDGQSGHGLSRLASYAAQARSGKVAGHAVPEVIDLTPAAARIDARNGFAFPAMDLAVETLAERTKAMGVAAAAVFNSHHFGVAGYHAERLADAGIVGLLFSNSPEAIAPWGGRNAVFGTNPIAFAAPRRGFHPLVVDLSLSKVARGKIMVAANRNEPIPAGWALDADGNPTTDAKAAMTGTMLPMGDAKGAALVLIVEILAAALTGGNFGFQASSFFTAEGAPPAIGHLMIGLDPHALSGGTFADRLEDLVSAISEQPGARLPGAAKLEKREAAREHGITLTSAVHEELLSLAGRT